MPIKYANKKGLQKIIIKKEQFFICYDLFVIWGGTLL